MGSVSVGGDAAAAAAAGVATSSADWSGETRGDLAVWLLFTAAVTE